MWLGVEARANLAALPVLLVIPWRCNLLAPSGAIEDAPAAITAASPRTAPAEPHSPGPSAAVAKTEAVTGRVPSVPPRAPHSRAITLADEVVVKIIGLGQPAFLRCWARAQRIDGAGGSTKVRLHVELDAEGGVTAARCDSDSPILTSCLTLVARRLPFPAPGQPAIVDVPLMFR
jgi:hypothetical protein